jgi:glycosyltransferase involved in cell wall biosynthesis
MLGISATRDVLLINSIGMRMPTPGRSPMFARRIFRKAVSTTKGLRRPVRDRPRFHVLSPIIVPFYGSKRARAANAVLVRAQVKAVTRLLGMRRPNVVVTIPTAWPIADPLARAALLFNRSDKHSSFGEVDQAFIGELERNLLTNSDRVLYVSHALMDADQELVGDRGVFLDHGVDLDHFTRRSETEEPDDLRSIPHPRVGFFGGIDDYVVDIGLLARVARELPEVSLVLVGDATCPLGELTSLANVHWLGRRPYASIPAYGSGFDVAIMPWLDNDWIRACNPIKLKEYLALGLPVVSTPFPELRRYEHLVAVAHDAETFVKLVARAVAGDAPGSPDERRRAVTSDSWTARAADVIRIAEESH